MAKSTKSNRNTGKVSTFPAPQNGVAVAEEPEEALDESIPEEFAPPAAEQTAPADSRPPRRAAGRPKNAKPPLESEFWQKVKQIPLADWGTRVYLYLYILEPLCNLKQSGGKVYLNRYAEPVQDEHQICMEYGSGRYRLMLAYNKVSPDQSNELARHEFEIYNPQHPPKVPRAAWINDARNAKWEALLPKETPQSASAAAASTIVDAMKVVGDIRRELREEMEPNELPDQQSPSEMVNTFKAMKDILQPAGSQAAAKDPIELATALATTMMQMKADNPIVDILRDELKAMREEAAKGRDREFQLQQQLMEAKNKPAAESGDFLDRLMQLAEKSEKIEGIKKLFGGLFGGGEVATRPARTTALDMVRDLASSPFGAQLGQGLGLLLTSLATSQPTNGAPRPGPALVPNPSLQNGTGAETPEQRIQRIGQAITQPMLYEFFLKDEPGTTFAERMFDMWPEDYVFIRNLGAENLVNRYRQFAPAWAVIGPKEPAFITFIQEFCNWNPNEDEGAAPPNNDDDGVKDLEPEEVGA